MISKLPVMLQPDRQERINPLSQDRILLENLDSPTHSTAPSNLITYIQEGILIKVALQMDDYL